MPQRIDVPGMGTVEFPDGMSDDQIAAAIKSNMSAPRGVVDQLTGGTGERFQTWPERLVRGLGQSVAELPSLPGRALKSAGDLQRTGDVYDPAPVIEAAGLATPLSPGIAAGERAIPGVGKSLVSSPVKTPTAQELKDVGGAGFDTAREMGVKYRAGGVADVAAKIRADLEKGGTFAEDAAGSFPKLNRLSTVPEGELSGKVKTILAGPGYHIAEDIREPAFSTFENLHSARKAFGRVAGDYARTNEDRMAATAAIKQIDAFLEKPGAENVLAGPAAALSPVFKDAKGNIAAAERSNDITGALDRAYTGILDRAELRAGSTASGRNLDNTLRQRTERILASPKEIRGFSEPEIAAMERIVEGGAVKNTARNIGNSFGGGGGLGALAAITTGAGFGAAGGGIPGAVAGALVGPGIGIAARQTANQLSKREVLALDEMIRKRSPLFLERQAAAPMEGMSAKGKASVLRGLLLEDQ